MNCTSLFSGIFPPQPCIAQTYKIGILYDKNNCIQEILNELTLNRYQVYKLEKLGNPWEIMSQQDFDFLIYKNEGTINFLIDKGQINESYDLEKIKSYCHAPIHYIWISTQHKNSKERSENLNTEIVGYTMPSAKIESDDETIVTLNAKLKLEPENSEIYFKIANVYASQNNYYQYYIHLKKAAKLNPFNCEITIALGNYFLQNEKHSLAIEEYSKCLDDPINSNPAYFQKRIFINEEKIAEDKIFFFIVGVIILIVFVTVFTYIKKRKSSNLLKKVLSINSLKKLIADGNLDKVFTILEDNFKKDKSFASLENQLTILKNRWNRINEKENLDIISLHDANIEKNRIINSILQLIQEGEKKPIT